MKRTVDVPRFLMVLAAVLSLSQFACVDQILTKIFPVKQKAPESSKTDPQVAAQSLARANDEILGEMFLVTFFSERSDIDAREFSDLSQSLKQGASIEGVYRGLIASSRYRTLESQTGAATPALLKAFAVELAQVRDGMKNPRKYSATEASDVPSVSYPDETDAGVDVKVFPLVTPQQAAVKKNVDEDAGDLAKTFVGASLFTLKRVLSEAALMRVDSLGGSHDQVAQWYAKLAVRLARAKIDFGLDQRNLADEDFHFTWAMKASDDRIKWEILNRYHRYLNALSQQR